jgi:hypothetical protein
MWIEDANGMCKPCSGAAKSLQAELKRMLR